MKNFTFRLAIAVVTFVVGVASALAWLYASKIALRNEQPTPVSRLQNARYGTLLWQVQQAKERGETVWRSSVLNCGMGVSTFNETLRNYTIAIAQPVEKKVLLENEDRVISWYRFQIIETLSARPATEHSKTWLRERHLPDEMLPVERNEFLMAQEGGRLEIEGMKIFYGSNNPQFTVGQKYLLFLEFDADKRFAYIPWPDDDGIFTVDDEGRIASTDKEPYDPRVGTYDLREKMERRFDSSVERLRKHLSRANMMQEK